MVVLLSVEETVAEVIEKDVDLIIVATPLSFVSDRGFGS